MQKGFFVICAAFSLFATDVHDFSGKHFIASYLHCDSQAISNLQGLVEAFDHAVTFSGATILNKSSYVFHPHGVTLVYLLSESHASLHTYPEFRSCFVDLFTCGNSATPQLFDAALRAYLNPKKVNTRCFHRHEEVDEIPYVLMDGS